MANHETILQSHICEAIGLRQGLAVWRNTVGFDRERKIHYGLKKGSADLVCCYRGLFLALEVKTPTGRQSSDQRDWEGTVLANGGAYYLVRSPEDALRALDEMDRRIDG